MMGLIVTLISALGPLLPYIGLGLGGLLIYWRVKAKGRAEATAQAKKQFDQAIEAVNKSVKKAADKDAVVDKKVEEKVKAIHEKVEKPAVDVRPGDDFRFKF